MINIKDESIFIFKYRAMGDAVIGLSTVSYLKEKFPDKKIIYGVPKWVAPLFYKVKSDADLILPMDISSIKESYKLLKNLKKEKVGLCYEMFQSGRTAKLFKFNKIFSNTPYLFHNHHLKEGRTIVGQGEIRPVIQRDLDGVFSQLTDQSDYPSHLSYPPKLTPLKKIENKKSRIVLGVVATRSTKMWNLKNYIKLAELLSEDDPNLELIIPLSNSSVDQEINRELEKNNLPENAKIINVSLEDLPGELAQAKLYIGNDTGLKHICVALGISTYTFFGPEPPLEWHPYSEENHKYFFITPLQCRTKIAHYCGLNECETMDCLNPITPEIVFEEIKKNKLG